MPLWGLRLSDKSGATRRRNSISKILRRNAEVPDSYLKARWYVVFLKIVCRIFALDEEKRIGGAHKPDSKIFLSPKVKLHKCRSNNI